MNNGAIAATETFSTRISTGEKILDFRLDAKGIAVLLSDSKGTVRLRRMTIAGEVQSEFELSDLSPSSLQLSTAPSGEFSVLCRLCGRGTSSLFLYSPAGTLLAQGKFQGQIYEAHLTGSREMIAASSTQILSGVAGEGAVSIKSLASIDVLYPLGVWKTSSGVIAVVDFTHGKLFAYNSNSGQISSRMYRLEGLARSMQLGNETTSPLLYTGDSGPDGTYLALTNDVSHADGAQLVRLDQQGNVLQSFRLAAPVHSAVRFTPLQVRACGGSLLALSTRGTDFALYTLR